MAMRQIIGCSSFGSIEENLPDESYADRELRNDKTFPRNAT